MYETPSHDTQAVAEALGAVPTGGFFCAGEIGPIGVKGLAAGGAVPTYLHGFTSVLAFLFDTSATGGAEGEAERASRED